MHRATVPPYCPICMLKVGELIAKCDKEVAERYSLL